jgi:integrase
MAPGIRQRHGSRCSGKGRCECPWRAEVFTKKDGKKIRKTFPTKAAAMAWRDDTRAAVRQRTLRAPTSTTLREAADAWVEGARGGLIRPRSGDAYKPAAVRHYERGLRLRVLPKLGHRRLVDIEREDLQRFVDEMIAAGSSAALIEASVIPIRAIYRHGMRSPSSGIAVNPTAGLELPATRGRRERIAPPHECASLLPALPDRDRALWATAMYAGLRRGELQALRIEDIDLPAGLIHVRHGWDQYEGQITTKSGKTRKVPIAPALRAHLAEHLLALGWREGLAFGTGPADPFVMTSVAWRADRAWEKAKLARITPHECRHTFASLMIAAGVNAKALSVYMGHANIGITMDRYGHLMPGNEDEAAELLDAYLIRADSDARIAQVVGS